MFDLMIVLSLLGVLITLLAAGVWVAVSLMLVGFVGFVFFLNVLFGLILVTTFWGYS